MEIGHLPLDILLKVAKLMPINEALNFLDIVCLEKEKRIMKRKFLCDYFYTNHKGILDLLFTREIERLEESYEGFGIDTRPVEELKAHTLFIRRLIESLASGDSKISD